MSIKLDTTLINLPRPRIIIDKFVGVYLPLLDVPAGEDTTFTVRWWKEVAGGLYNSVDVMDGNGTVAYTVPPIREPFTTFSDSGLGLLATKFQKHSEVHKAAAMHAFTAQLPKVVTISTPPKLEHVKVWDMILNKHGYGHLTSMDLVPEVEEIAETSFQQDDDDW